MVPRPGGVRRDRSEYGGEKIRRCSMNRQSMQQSINVPTVSFRPMWLGVILGKFLFHEYLPRVVDVL